MNYTTHDNGKLKSFGYSELGEGQKKASFLGESLCQSIDIKYLEEVAGEIRKVANFEIEIQKGDIISCIENKSKVLLSEGYAHSDGNVFHVNGEMTDYWNSVINRYEGTTGECTVLSIAGIPVTYSRFSDIKQIYDAGFDKAMGIKIANNTLIGRTKAASTQEELDQIMSDSESR